MFLWTFCHKGCNLFLEHLWLISAFIFLKLEQQLVPFSITWLTFWRPTCPCWQHNLAHVNVADDICKQSVQNKFPHIFRTTKFTILAQILFSFFWFSSFVEIRKVPTKERKTKTCFKFVFRVFRRAINKGISQVYNDTCDFVYLCLIYLRADWLELFILFKLRTENSVI